MSVSRFVLAWRATLAYVFSYRKAVPVLASLVLLLTSAAISNASVIAYDGINYSVPGGLNGKTGGTGFGSNAWTAVSGQADPALASGSLTYLTLPTEGNMIAPAVNSRSTRNFPSTITTANQTLWVSFRGNQTAASMPTNHAGFHLSSGLDGTGTYIFLGKPGFSATNWGMDHSGTVAQKSGAATSADRNAFLVYKLQFGASSVTISMWVNPTSLASEAAMGTVTQTLTKSHTTDIASMNISIGGNASNFQFDEFRFGTTFNDVVSNPVSATDDFNYTGGLVGKNGGTGFGTNAWALVSGLTDPALATGSMAYTSGSDALVTSGNKIQPVGNSRATRDFPSPITTAGKIYWVSFRVNQTGTGSLPTNHAGFSLFSGTAGSGTELFMGHPASGANYGVYHSGGGGTAIIPGTLVRDVLLVYKLDFTTANTVNISVWSNPPLSGTLPSPAVTLSQAHTTNLGSLRFSTGSNSINYQFDEFRLGESYAAVTPYTTAPPQGGTGPDLVLHPGTATTIVGTLWTQPSVAGTASGKVMYNQTGSQINPQASPADYFEMTFTAPANLPYRLWARMKADADNTSNAAVSVQFNDSIDSAGVAVHRIGTTQATVLRLQEATSRTVQGWGWASNLYGPRFIGDAIKFANSGTHTIRVQRNRSGCMIDQIVLSPAPQAMWGTRPGAMLNDNTILSMVTNGTTPTADPTLRILCANIHKFRSTAEVSSYERTASEIALFDATLIGTNETVNYPAELETALEAKTGIPWHRYYDGGGNQILSKITFNSTETRTQSGGTMVRGQITFNGKIINFFVSHLHATDSSIRTAQLNNFLPWSLTFSENRIMVGDWNIPSTSSELNATKVNYWDAWNQAVDASTATAYPPDNPVSYHTKTRRNRLDYVWLSKGSTQVTTASAKIPDYRDPRTYSTSGPMNALNDFLAQGIWTDPNGTGPESMVLDTHDDKGIRASDHNWMLVKFNVP